MKASRSLLVNKLLLPPLAYIRSQIIYPIFNNDQRKRTHFRNKLVHLKAFLLSKISTYDNKKIDIFIVGGQKCGTTALHNYLIQNPRINQGLTKELHYFDYEPYFFKI